MKAFLASAYGGPEVMAIGETPDPAPRQGEVVVAVRATSVNPVDWKVRDGAARLLTGRRFPKVYGCDLAGVVQAVGPGVTGLAAGDPVYGSTPVMLGKPGAHAERVAVAARRLRPLPPGIGFEQAAALPVAALTALAGLRQCGDLAGRKVIVNGATGGVGHFALQIARAHGATVTAVCSARNVGRAMSLGAEVAIDYQARDFTREPVRYDVVFDAFGGLAFGDAARALAPRGSYVTTLGSPALVAQALWQRILGGPRVVFANMRARPEDYAALEALVVAGRVRPVVERVFPLERAADAFAALEGGGTVGKVVIRVG
jgi:NADPH:quinone reductase-like Zn-dependent oxidoreductase